MSADVKKPTPIWSCKIGTRENFSLRPGADYPMRRAVEAAFWNITGLYAEFNFSGWIAELTEDELAVVENRIPGPEHYAAERIREAAPDLLEALTLLDTLIDFGEPASDDKPMVFADWSEMNAAFIKARAAILKAEGPSS